MRIYAINGSPRKKWNTGTILQNVLDGAAETADDILTEMVNLYDYDYKGCLSCFQCKKIGGSSYGKCAVKDGITPIIQNALDADVLVLGTPVYFGDMTGMLRCFLERLLFANFVYDKNYTSLAPKKVYTAFVYTMNVTHDAMEEWHYPERFKMMEDFTGRVFGHAPRILHVNNTFQFPDYSKYKNEVFSPEEKAGYREEHFPIDCRHARELGAALAADANGEAQNPA